MPRTPRAASGEVAKKPVTIRLTESEYQQIAEKKGALSFSEFFRRAGLEQTIPIVPSRPTIPEVNRQTYIELGHIGNNLNQQTQACHVALQQGQDLDIDWQPLEALSTLVKQVRLEVAGIEPIEATDDELD
ncbi:MAG: hypothetical protein AAFX78_09335 [Cyanobacteria bacterium J06638_20]